MCAGDVAHSTARDQYGDNDEIVREQSRIASASAKSMEALETEHAPAERWHSSPSDSLQVPRNSW